MKNPIIEEYRIARDSYDPWGSALSWHFAIADYLTDMGQATPSAWEYQQSLFGSDHEAYEYKVIEEIFSTTAISYQVESLVNAGNVLGRYSNLCREAGLDY